ncbi:MAG: hypothetical protein JW751_24540 [Polyangiaceae bacterium]|nr:hypothetical protein [Polyangiaceae bacterium]
MVAWTGWRARAVAISAVAAGTSTACGGQVESTRASGGSETAAGSGARTPASGGEGTGGWSAGGGGTHGDEPTTAGTGAEGASNGAATAGGAGGAATAGTGIVGSAGTGALGGSSGTAGSLVVGEDSLDDCGGDAECIVVPYDHCCGATRRAINSAYAALYQAHPEWQIFDDPGACSVLGACQDDSRVTAAICTGEPAGFCELVFPESCPALDCELDCPFGSWNDETGCATCACAAPAPTLTTQDLQAPSTTVTLLATPGLLDGDIRRTFLTVRFRYDDPTTEDEELWFTVRITLMHPPIEVTETMATYLLSPRDPGLEEVNATQDFDPLDTSIPIEVSSGFLSIRELSDGALDGAVYLTSPNGTTLGGAFETAP